MPSILGQRNGPLFSSLFGYIDHLSLFKVRAGGERGEGGVFGRKRKKEKKKTRHHRLPPFLSPLTPRRKTFPALFLSFLPSVCLSPPLPLYLFLFACRQARSHSLNESQGLPQWAAGLSSSSALLLYAFPFKFTCV